MVVCLAASSELMRATRRKEEGEAIDACEDPCLCVYAIPGAEAVCDQLFLVVPSSACAF